MDATAGVATTGVAMDGGLGAFIPGVDVRARVEAEKGSPLTEAEDGSHPAVAAAP